MEHHGPILVPLDGSELAEGALPYASAIAHALRTHLVLITIWEGTAGELGKRFPDLVVQLDESASAHYTAYLDRVRDRLQHPETRIVIRPGEASDEIVRAADEVGARMIVVATHGRAGIRRWAYGSNLSHVVAASRVPVLAVGPHALERAGDRPSFSRVLVPLHGSAFAEAALPVATELTRALGARLSLMRVVPWAVQMYPYTAAETYVPSIDEALESDALAYMERQAAALGGAVDTHVERGEPADKLIDFIESERIDLVVMSTHGREGLARTVLGSTADRMLQSRAPVLLVRPEDAEIAAREAARKATEPA